MNCILSCSSSFLFNACKKTLDKMHLKQLQANFPLPGQCPSFREEDVGKESFGSHVGCVQRQVPTDVDDAALPPRDAAHDVDDAPRRDAAHVTTCLA